MHRPNASPSPIERKPGGDASLIPVARQVRALPAHLSALHARLAKVRPASAVLAFGDPRIDGHLPGGGLPLGQLHEIATGGVGAETGVLPAAFSALLLGRIAPALPIIWIATRDDLYPPALVGFGLDPGRVVFVRPDGDAGVLAAMETALREAGAAAVVGELARFPRVASRRLQLACIDHGVTGFVLRRWPYGGQHADRDARVTATRWHLMPWPSQSEEQDPGPACWHVSLEQARGGRPGKWIMEQQEDPDAPHPLRVVAVLADRTPSAWCDAG